MAGIELDAILNALPEDSKPTGVEKLSKLVLEKALTLESTIQPTLEGLILQRLPSELITIIQPLLNNPTATPTTEQKNLIKQELQSFNSTLCPTADNLDEILLVRNNIIGLLENFNTTISTLSRTLTGSSRVLNTIIQALGIIKTTRIALNAINKAAPVAPGATTAAIEDLNEVQNTATFDSKGVSKLEKLQESINQARIPISIVSTIVAKLLTLLEVIDLVILRCKPDANLTQVPSDLTALKTLQDEASSESLATSYNGYLIKIITVPFSSTVNRVKAVAYDSNGVPVLETDLSFTTQPQLLIDQLKLKINSEF
jgi:hypothetical protein